MTRKQANFVGSGEIINTETLQQELEYKRQLNKIDDTSGDTNPYKELIVNNAEKLEPVLAQMEQWSILSNMLNYIEHDKFPQNFHNLGISTVNICKNNSGIEEENVIEVDFGPTPYVLREEYLDVRNPFRNSEYHTRFDENSDLSTTYLGKSDRSKNDKLKAEESFPISEHGYTSVKLLEQNVNYFWIQVQANCSCQNHSTCIVSHFMLCQNLLPRHKEFR